jgi:hypothetical protein
MLVPAMFCKHQGKARIHDNAAVNWKKQRTKAIAAQSFQNTQDFSQIDKRGRSHLL